MAVRKVPYWLITPHITRSSIPYHCYNFVIDELENLHYCMIGGRPAWPGRVSTQISVPEL
jgi:hypothetical protein